MINVLIVDDEPNVRLGLQKIIPWQENGFKVCGEGIDADDGLEKIMNLNPDIVLMDIKMPGRLGIDIIRDVRERGFRGKFIILSGYSNFEYAKEAIKYGVKSYILKPIDEDELLEDLLKLSKEIKIERTMESKKNLLKKFDLRNLILGTGEDIDESYYGLSTVQMALIKDCFDEDNLEREEKVNKLLREYLSFYDNLDVLDIDKYTVILFKDYKDDRVRKSLEEVLLKINKDGYSNVFAAISRSVSDVTRIRSLYIEAKRLIGKSFLYLEDKIISADEVELYSEDSEIEIRSHIDKIYSYIEVNDIDRLSECLDELKRFFKINQSTEREIKITAIETCLELKEKLINDYKLNKESFKNNEEIIHEIYLKNSLNKTIKYLKDNFKSMASEISVGSSNNNVKRILKYMQRNYYKDLKLESLAEIFNYNSAYLGKLLKSSTGENFNTHLDKIRIEKAKHYLVEENLKVYEVCEKVGYKNIDYFHSKFKKYVGISPLNYKKKNDTSMEKIV